MKLFFFLPLFGLILAFSPMQLNAQENLCFSLDGITPNLLFDQSYYREQVATYSAALADNAADAELLTLRGDAHYALYEHHLAIADYQRAIALAPDNAYTYARLGDSYQQEFLLQESFAAYNRALEIDPNFAYVYIKRAVLYRKLGDVKTDSEQSLAYNYALEDFNRAIELDPNSSLAYVRRSELYTSADALDLALADALRAVSLDPEGVFAYTTLGNVLFRLGDNAAALRNFELALQFPSDQVSDFAYAYASRAKVCRRLGAYPVATENALLAIEYDSHYANAYLELGLTIRANGNPLVANLLLLGFIGMNPLEPFAYEVLETGQVPDALYAGSRATYEFWRQFTLEVFG